MKMAPLVRAFGSHHRPSRVALMHTGQHYDVAMNARLFADLELPAPDIEPRGRLRARTRYRPRRSCGASSLCSTISRPQLRHRRRRRQLDAGVQPGRHQERRSGRPRRGRAAQLRPRHAGRNQPDPDRPDCRPACIPPERARRRQSRRAKASLPRAHSVRRQRDDRFTAVSPRGLSNAAVTLAQAGDPGWSSSSDTAGFGVADVAPSVERRCAADSARGADAAAPLLRRCIADLARAPATKANIERFGLANRSLTPAIALLPPQGYLEMLGLPARARASC